MNQRVLHFASKWSIRQKLIGIVLAVSVPLLLLVSAVYFVQGQREYRKYLLDDIKLIGKIIGSKSAAALEFMDQDAADENLSASSASPVIHMVCLYDTTGAIFADYKNPNFGDAHHQDHGCPPKPDKGIAFGEDTVSFSNPVLAGDREVGFLYLEAGLYKLQEYFYSAIWVTLAWLGLAVIVALLLTERFQRLISEPIRDLVGVVGNLGTRKDYTVRATKHGEDELGTLVDAFNTMIAELQEHDKQLVAAKDEAEHANRMKSEFLANMSHELRTPLNSLLILAESFVENDEGNLTDDQKEAAKIIHGSGSDLLALINDILDLAKVEAGKMTIQPEYIMLQSFIESVQLKYQHVAQQKKLGFIVKITPGLPETIYTDAMRLEQILRNLLSNAFKFTHEGGITVTVSRCMQKFPTAHGMEVSGAALAFTVTDTGIGIPEDKKEIIFKPFQQADGSTSRKYGGTGLGLSICVELARLLEGKFEMDSKEGVGTSFTLYLPMDRMMPTEAQPAHGRKTAHATAAPTYTAPEDIRPEDRLVMIIEDDPRFVDILRAGLERANVRTLVATTGMQALKLAETYHPHAIILDIELPDTNGLKVIEKIKETSHLSDVPVYIISIQDMDVKTLPSGVAGYLTKPVSKGQLVRTFSKIESLLFPSPQKVLLVEDSKTMRDKLVKVLEESGRGVLTAQSGKEAKQFVQDEKVGCIILDMWLPDMKGFELLEDLEKLGVRLPPVIVYSAGDIKPEYEERFRKYTDIFVRKNADATDLILERMLGAWDHQSSPAMHAAVDSHSTAPVAPYPVAASPSAAPEVSPVAAGRKISVLVVDDDMRNTFALSKLLRTQNMEVLMASDGKKALDMLEQQKVDIVLMDIMMPVMDGYEAIHRIRSQERFTKLPVVAVTAKAMAEDREKCMAIGASAYIAKPVDKQTLFTTMKELLDGNKTA